MTNLILNGKLIYRVDEIADNYNEAELVEAFKTDRLTKWLDQKSEEVILQSVRKIKGDSKNVASALIKALGLDPQLCSKAEKKAKAEQEAIAKRKEEERKAKEEEERKAKEVSALPEVPVAVNSQIDNIGDFIKLWQKAEARHNLKELDALRACDFVFDLAEKSAKQRDAQGQCVLGFCYYKGIGVEADDKLAFHWFKKSAEQGCAMGQAYLGYCYRYGIGVEENSKLAFQWTKKSAEQGDSNGQYGLGWCYAFGYGVEETPKQAFQWYRKSAEQGHVLGQYWLGFCYENGIGTEANIELAVQWYRKASEQGNADAKKALDAIRKSSSK